MRVAIVINTSWNIFNYRRGLIKALIEEGCEVLAIAPEDEYSGRFQELGCQFVPLKMDNKGMNPFKDFMLFIRMYLLYRRLKPDFVLQYTIKPNIYGTFAASLLGIKCVNNVSGLGTAFIRQGILQKIVKLLYRQAFRLPQRVFFQNKDDRNLFVELGLVKKEQTALLPGSGIDVMCFNPPEYKRHTPFTFLLIARLLSDKGIREYAEASKILSERGYAVESQLVGFFDRASKYNISEEELNRWIDDGTIVFLNESKNIQLNISNCDCVVLPSYREGTPRSLLEAMAMEKPIITTNVPGCIEVLQEGENGFLCEVRNSKSLADAMEKMLLLSDDELLRMGKKGREIAVQKFDERLVIRKYMHEIFPNNE